MSNVPKGADDVIRCPGETQARKSKQSANQPYKARRPTEGKIQHPRLPRNHGQVTRIARE